MCVIQNDWSAKYFMKPKYLNIVSQPRRNYATEEKVNEETLMNKQEFHRIADALLDSFATKIEEQLEDHVPDMDVTYSDGVLNLQLGKYGNYAINKQTPNRQIWFSSPVSGPKRFNYDATKKAWVNTRDGHELRQLLGKELTQLVNKPVDLL